MPGQSTDTPGATVNADSHAWDQGAAGWDRNGAFIGTWLQDVTTAMLDAVRIGAGSAVLDIAAGAGGQTLDIARRVGPRGRVLATDLSEQFLALARAHADAQGLHQVQTCVADAQSLGLAGAGFDAAVCRLGLMYCTDPLAALAEVKAALKPGGRFSAVVFSHPRNNPCVTMSMSVARWHTGLPALSPDAPIAAGTLFSLGEPGLLGRLLVDAGFEDVDVRPVDAPHSLASAGPYVDFVRTGATPIIAMLASLSDSEKNRVWDDLEERLKVFNTPDGWEGPNELLLCSATAPRTHQA